DHGTIRTKYSRADRTIAGAGALRAERQSSSGPMERRKFPVELRGKRVSGKGRESAEPCEPALDGFGTQCPTVRASLLAHSVSGRSRTDRDRHHLRIGNLPSPWCIPR